MNMPNIPANPPLPPPVNLPAVSTAKKEAIEFLGKRPPLPPQPVDQSWTWTRAKLKAIYLDAFTDIAKTEISEIVKITDRTLRTWRNHPEYKKYLADLVYSDGLASKIERTKIRKKIADKLTERIIDKLNAGPSPFESLTQLLKSYNDLLVAMGQDVETWEIASAGQSGDVSRRKTEGLNLVDQINAIENLAERETVKRHLLKIFKNYMQAGPARDTTAASAPESKPEQLINQSSMQDKSNAVQFQDTEQSSRQDLDNFNV